MAHPKIKSVWQTTQLNGVKLMVYGRPGTGKTSLCATLPKPLILSAESGLLSLRRMIAQTGRDLPAWQINSIADLGEALAYVQTPNARKLFNSVCLDSITEIAEICLAAERKKTKDLRKAYGEMYVKVVELLRDFRNLDGYHVYFSAQEHADKDAMQNLYFSSSFPGQRLSAASLYQFDEVFRAFVGFDSEGKNFHALQTHATEFVDAKDRSGMLDPVEYPDLSNVINKIMS